MSITIISGSGNSALQTVDNASKAGRVTLYDAAGNPLGTAGNPLQAAYGTGRTMIGEYMVSSFRTLGSAATPQNFFAMWVPAGTTKVAIKRLTAIIDSTALLATVSPSFKVSRLAAQPTGGTTLAAVKFQSAYTANVLSVLGGTASDGGVATAITAAPGVTAWTDFADRLVTAAGFTFHLPLDLAPNYIDDRPLILTPGEGLLVQSVLALAATFNLVFNMAWEEFT